MKWCLRTYIFFLAFFPAGCFTNMVWKKVYPGPVRASPEQIESVAIGTGNVLRFQLRSGGVDRFVCFSVKADGKLLQGPLRSDRGESCDFFEKAGSDLVRSGLESPDSTLVLPDGVDSLISLNGIDGFNFITDSSFRYFPALKLEMAELSRDGKRLYLISPDGKYIVIQRAKETGSYVKYYYRPAWGIDESGPGSRTNSQGLVTNDLGDNGNPRGSDNTGLGRIPVVRRLLVLYFYSDDYLKGGQKLIFELPDNFRPEVRHTFHVHILSFEDGYHPAYFFMMPLSVPLDIVTSPFQAVYCGIGLIATGQLAH